MKSPNNSVIYSISNMPFQFILGKQHKVCSIQFSVNKEQLEVSNITILIILWPGNTFQFIWQCEKYNIYWIIKDKKLKETSMCPKRTTPYMIKSNYKAAAVSSNWEEMGKAKQDANRTGFCSNLEWINYSFYKAYVSFLNKDKDSPRV